jgi:hypothetical protein
MCAFRSVLGMTVQKRSYRGGGRAGVARCLSLGFDIAAGAALFTFGGYWLDRKTGGGQFWTLVGMVLGFVYAGYEIWRAMRSIQEQDRRAAEDKDSGQELDTKNKGSRT